MQQEARKIPRERPSIEVVPDAPADPDAFLRWAASQPREEGRYELSRGVVTRAMINVTAHHNRICRNILSELSRGLDPDRHDWGSGDFAVRTPFGVRGPDIFVAALIADGRALFTEHPIFLAEVLSPSTAGIDFVEKRDEYLAIASLQTYLICSQDEPRVWVWSRTADGAWPSSPTMLERREDVVGLGRLGIELTLAAIYRGVPDPASDAG